MFGTFGILNAIAGACTRWKFDKCTHFVFEMGTAPSNSNFNKNGNYICICDGWGQNIQIAFRVHTFRQFFRPLVHKFSFSVPNVSLEHANIFIIQLTPRSYQQHNNWWCGTRSTCTDWSMNKNFEQTPRRCLFCEIKNVIPCVKSWGQAIFLSCLEGLFISHSTTLNTVFLFNFSILRVISLHIPRKMLG